MRNMKSRINWQWCRNNFTRCIVIGAIILVALLAVCLSCAHNWNSNFVSLLGGVLSALATVFLGSLTLYQMKQYKKFSDELHDRENAPEFFVTTFANNEEGATGRIPNSIEAYGDSKASIRMQKGLWFTMLKKPILELKPVCIKIADYEGELKTQGESQINSYVPYSTFEIKLKNCFPESLVGQFDYQLVLEYKDIYLTKYSKSFYGSALISNGRVLQQTWGRVTPAERIGLQPYLFVSINSRRDVFSM